MCTSTENFILQKFHSVCVSVNVPQQTPRTYFGSQIPPTMNISKKNSRAINIIGLLYIATIIVSGILYLTSSSATIVEVCMYILVVCALIMLFLLRCAS